MFGTFYDTGVADLLTVMVMLFNCLPICW